MSARQATTPRKLTDLLDASFMARLDALDVLSRKMLQGKLRGERRAKRRGQSVEFADHRPYVVGDDLRFVDWNIYGRLDQLFLKLFLEELDLSLHVMVDVSGSTDWGEPNKSLAMRKLAAAIAYVGLVSNSRVTLTAFADGIVAQAPSMRGRRHARQMGEFLLAAEPEGASHFEKACRQFETGRGGSGVVVVISDFFFKEGYDAGLRRLMSDRYDLYAVQMLTPQETAPDLSGDLVLVDVEDGDGAEVTVSSALMTYYKRNLAAYCNELKSFCTRRGAAYILTSSAEATEQLVLNTLRRYGLLR
ncbi:MAG TPA: DUF58 domain-containing protein [Phycisphaerae bacterium]|nr:DUF58 domain-containing protein [Phycisphaerae bacterium]HUU23678.1 DUF58 domain-containing protein [Phycisphaerae bacterium]